MSKNPVSVVIAHVKSVVKKSQRFRYNLKMVTQYRRGKYTQAFLTYHKLKSI